MPTNTKTTKILDKAASSRKTVKFKIANRKLKRAGLPTYSFKGTVVKHTDHFITIKPKDHTEFKLNKSSLISVVA